MDYALRCEQDFGVVWDYEFSYSCFDDLYRKNGFPFWEEGIKNFEIPIDDPEGVLNQQIDFFNSFCPIAGCASLAVVSSVFVEALGEGVLEEFFWLVPLVVNGCVSKQFYGLQEKVGVAIDIGEKRNSSILIQTSVKYHFIVNKDLYVKLKGMNIPDSKWRKIRRWA